MTLTDENLFKLFECLGDKARSTVVDGELRLTSGDKVLARGRLEPMFAWRAGEPFSWARADLARDVPPTSSAVDAGDLAWGAARHLGAFAVYRSDTEWKVRFVAARYHAVFDFESAELDAPATRADRVQLHVEMLLRKLADGLREKFVEYGSVGGPEYGRRVSQSAALMAAFASHVAHDLPIRAEIEALVATMNDWSLRAVIPTDEALRVSVDVQAALDAWIKKYP